MYRSAGSKLGALLDMLTDRMGTTALLVVLSHLYKHAWGFFVFLIVLDIVSHWLQMYRYMCSPRPRRLTHRARARDTQHSGVGQEVTQGREPLAGELLLWPPHALLGVLGQRALLHGALLQRFLPRAAAAGRLV